MLTRQEHLFGNGPKRILSLDGGGVRGLLTLGMLLKVEAILRDRMPPDQRASFRLCDYFDLIGGTSTGGIIASLLALGYDVESIIKIYLKMAPEVFGKSSLFQGVRTKFDSAALERAITGTLADFLEKSGRDRRDTNVLRMNSDLLRTGLALVTKRIDRGSVWVLTNNPDSKYWDPRANLWNEHFQSLQRDRDFYPNSDYPLATIIRAGASAPFYLNGVDIGISNNERGHFLDGGASPFNNPAQELFLMTTLKSFGHNWPADGCSPYGFKWETGANKLLLLSLGTGTWRLRLNGRAFSKSWALNQAKAALLSIIDDASLSSTVWLQAMSECPRASNINGNLEEMHELRFVRDPLLTFRRVSPRLESDWLRALDSKFDFSPREIEKSRELDHSAKANLARLLEIGTATGNRDITGEDFPSVFDLQEMRADQMVP